MEVMCTDLVACGECFVPDDRAGQTLVRFCSFVPIEVDEALDGETSRFMADAHGEAYGRGVGLPGIAWATSRASVVVISSLTRDLSFDSGGKRLSRAGRLFHTAMVVPLYSLDGIRIWGVGVRQLMGVVVIYFPGPENHASALIAYASAVADSASAMSELMVHRSLFVEGRANRVKRNWRVMRIALKFLFPMFIRYHKLTGRTISEGADVDSMEAGGATTTIVTTASTLPPTAFRAPRHKLSIDRSKRAPIAIDQTGGIPAGAVAVLSSREAAKRMPRPDGTKAGFRDWLAQYVAKAAGGPVHMPEPANPRDAFVTWSGTFVSIGLLEMTFNLMNGSIHWRAQEDMFVLSGSFGALCTLLFALPAVPLAQPRVMLSAHTLAILVSVMAVSVFEQGRMVWLQKALTVSSVILGMSLMGTVHPPAGALCLVILGAHNKGASPERMMTLVLSVGIGLVVHIAVAISINNLSPRRGYPVFW